MLHRSWSNSISPRNWDGSVSWNDPAVTQALENFNKVLDCTNEDRATSGWVGGIDLVINDQAAFNIMVDWAYGEVLTKGAADYVTWNPAPGNQDVFFLVSDGFAIPKEAPNPENAMDFREFQNFNDPKKVLKLVIIRAK